MHIFLICGIHMPSFIKIIRLNSHINYSSKKFIRSNSNSILIPWYWVCLLKVKMCHELIQHFIKQLVM